MPDFDRLLIAPRPQELRRALDDAVRGINGKARLRLLEAPLAGREEAVGRVADTPEGWRQWNGGPSPPRSWESRSSALLLWWTDPAGRKHVRIVGRRDRFSRGQLNHLLCPDGEPLPALALVHHDHIFLGQSAGGWSPVAVCGCGVYGPPEKIGWMGTSCGPCHDRREDGVEPPRAWPDPAHTTLPCAGERYGSAGAILAFSPDGRSVATCVGAGQVTLWDLDGGPPRTFARDPSARRPLTCGAWTPDGRFLMTGSVNGEVTAWEIATGQGRRVLDFNLWIHDLALSPDGTLLAVARAARDAVLYDLRPDGRAEARFERLGNQRNHQAVVFSPDGTTLAVGTWDGAVSLWDVRTGQERAGPTGLGGQVADLSFAPDGKTLAVAVSPRYSMGGVIQHQPVTLWEVARGRRAGWVGTPDDAIWQAAFSPSDGLLVTGHQDGTLRVWEPGQQRPRQVVRWHPWGIEALSFSPDGTLLASLDGGLAKVWPWEAVRDAGG